MAESKSTKNLYQKLLAITEEIGKIEKTGRNSQQGYAFIEQARVVAEVRVQLAKHGVMIVPETVSRSVEKFTNAKGTNFFHANVISRYTLINADNPEDKMVCDWDAGEALDTSDKATNKATTASQKYFLMKLFNISDQEDPDADSPTNNDKPAITPAQPRPAAPSQPAVVHHSAPDPEPEEKPTPTASSSNPPSANQLNLIKRIMNEKVAPDEQEGFMIDAIGKIAPENSLEASTVIQALMKARRSEGDE